ncbi:DUF4129 domain-containing protein [Algibacter aquimarinus]|uniref:DUF4129 domain-containing protein n=1 Tax=Algibacter aquimarinus TaxID=1136748 RepID=A0ABP9GZL2_9FLAO
MNKSTWLHIIFLCIGFLFISESSASVNPNNFEVVLVEKDSLQIDTSSIEKRHFDNLKDTYTGEDYIYERTVESSGWWARFKQWINDWFMDLFNLKNKGQASNLTDIAIKIAGVIIFLLVIYFIFKAVINDEGTWVFGKSSDKSIIPVTDIEANIQATDFKALINSAEKENNYRLAVRYYYLWILKNLANAEIIDYDVEKTNSDYQNEITQTDVKEKFNYTSYLYNYIWYGEFDVDDKQFNKAKSAFINFLKDIKA